ncbi:NAD(P)-dependent dehydrogenase, short-chain alcohol dehydrogenase family [Fictibacillus solisalsi]|uniref:NAD(P)-dependent dehydrogenase, short-chain alcohol dehydrogenase family n=1 Tax=Fictibacillus solisalsi TaxID=459525 RepID=A0A1G9TFU8_9BACL|nr:SDR family NAD(P)-dependent oxidoreductase [Fictibacillus solisalsi]SDM46606.1 NAD(P)-dependent dehydrogenase, short-chain alcohol dehydrogenase family [Fictibacillus solisalsi]
MGTVYSQEEGKVAVVTGGGSGIGKASCIAFAKEGMKVCVLDVKEERAEETAKEIREAGGEAIAAEVDVTKEDQVKAGIEKAVKEWARLDVLYANAGINGTLSSIEKFKLEDWNTTISTNLTGTFLTVKHAVPHLKKGGGSIVITASINGNRSFSGFGMSAYSSTKAAQVAFMKMAALELARYKIRVNAICPGAISTNIGQNTHPTDDVKEISIPVEYPEGNQPLEHKAGEPEQVADLALFLASERSSHISGTEVYIDGAETLL